MQGQVKRKTVAATEPQCARVEPRCESRIAMACVRMPCFFWGGGVVAHIRNVIRVRFAMPAPSLPTYYYVPTTYASPSIAKEVIPVCCLNVRGHALGIRHRGLHRRQRWLFAS